MTLEQIEKLTVENVFHALFARLFDMALLPEGEAPFTFIENETPPFYERVLFNPIFEKPPIAVFELELSEYKQELITIENARLAEVERVQNIEDRFYAIEDIRGAIHRADLDIPNPAIELKRIINENDTSRLSLLESSHIDFQEEIFEKEQNKRDESIADGLINLCLGCVKIVMKHNIKNALTADEKDAQAEKYQEVFNALKDWRPGKFKKAVISMEPDNVLVKKELKDELISHLVVNGL